MSRLSQYRVLITGILSPLAALVFYAVVYMTLTEMSSDLEKDWLFRLSLSAKVGFLLAVFSLALMWKPIGDGVIRYKQQRNLALRDVPAPAFNTVDLSGKSERLEDQKGKVVLVNIWATWCGPCREEFPKLDHLYREHKDQGFVVFGFSTEDPSLQRKFVHQVPVSFPLLTTSAGVPSFYKDIVRYPAFVLIDRKGQLQTAPAPDDGSRQLEAT